MKIDDFRGDYRFLSNFYPSRIYDVFTDVTYATVEHAFQAAKTHSPVEKNYVRLAETPGDAKRRGQEVTLRPDWHEVRKDVMRNLLRVKFAAWRVDDLQDAPEFAFNDVAHKLMDTFPADLIEGNHWHDTYFGVCYGSTKCDCPSEGVGQNWLGRLLVERREQLMKYRDNIAGTSTGRERVS